MGRMGQREGGLGLRVGQGWGQPLLQNPNPPPKPGSPTWVSSTLCMLKRRCRAKKTHWHFSGITWSKKANAPLPQVDPSGSLDGHRNTILALPEPWVALALGLDYPAHPW